MDKKQAKAQRKAFKAAGGFIVYQDRLTVLFFPTCKGKGEVSWSICSEADKFKKWKGFSVAEERLQSGGLPIERYPADYEEAGYIADFLADGTI